MELNTQLIELEPTFRADMELFYAGDDLQPSKALHQPVFTEHCGMLSLVGFIIGYQLPSNGIILTWSRIDSISELERLVHTPDQDSNFELINQLAIYETDVASGDPCVGRGAELSLSDEHTSIVMHQINNQANQCKWTIRFDQITTFQYRLDSGKFWFETCDVRIRLLVDGTVVLDRCTLDDTISAKFTGSVVEVEYAATNQKGTGTYFSLAVSALDDTDLSRCGSDYLVQGDARIHSINYPETYFPHRRCDWHITRASDKGWTLLTFDAFQLEAKSNQNECYDMFQVYDSRMDYDKLIATFCGHELVSKRIVTDIEDVHITFRSDGFNQEIGFSADVEHCNDKPVARDTDLLLVKSVYRELKQQYRLSLLHSISINWFKDNKGIPDEATNSMFLECQLRNFFNSQFSLPVEHSCYKNEPSLRRIKKANFNDSCGIQTIAPRANRSPVTLKVDRENKIIAGNAANKGSWPWMASLRKSYSSAHYCGGVLISDEYVLTAAHCIYLGLARLIPYTHNNKPLRTAELCSAR